MSNKNISLPTPKNEKFHSLLQKCNEASEYFKGLNKKQILLRKEMNVYPLLSKRNFEVISLLKKELLFMDNIINPIREKGYEMFANPQFDYKEKDPIKTLFATQHYTLFILNRVKLVEDDYRSCLENHRKIVSENKYLYTKNISQLSILIAILSIAITFFTVISSISINNYFYFRLF